MTETQFFYWLQWLDVKGRMWVHDPREVGRVGSAPAEARRLHNAACRFGWVKDDMVGPSVSDLFVRAQGKQVSVQKGADFEDVVKDGTLESPVRVYDQQPMG